MIFIYVGLAQARLNYTLGWMVSQLCPIVNSVEESRQSAKHMSLPHSTKFWQYKVLADFGDFTTNSPNCYLSVILSFVVYSRVQNNSWPLAIFQPISLFDQSKLTLVGHIYCTFAVE